MKFLFSNFKTVTVVTKRYRLCPHRGFYHHDICRARIYLDAVCHFSLEIACSTLPESILFIFPTCPWKFKTLWKGQNIILSRPYDLLQPYDLLKLGQAVLQGRYWLDTLYSHCINITFSLPLPSSRFGQHRVTFLFIKGGKR